jgi:hypothetical protein
VGSAIDHLGWRALRSDEKLAEIRGRGVNVTSGPNDLTFVNGTIRVFFIDGPNDVNIEVVQRAPNMR